MLLLYDPNLICIIFFLAMGNDCLECSGVGPVGRDPVQHPGPPPPLHQPWLELQPGDCPQARRNILRSRSHRAHLLPEAAGRCGRGLSGSCPPRLEQHRPRKNASQPSNLIRSPAGNYFVILYNFTLLSKLTSSHSKTWRYLFYNFLFEKLY